MNKEFTSAKPECGKEKTAGKNPSSKLYVICLNKPLIELWAMADRYTPDYYDTTERYKASVYSKPGPGVKSDDSIQGLLSPDDEMMLYNEGLTEYY